MPDMFFGHVGDLRLRETSNMIFGFNTDTRVQGTVYHVQTEVREHEQWLQSQVFVSGRCIGKRSTALPAGAGEEAIQELARAQHRWVLEAVRDGFVDEVLNQETAEELVVQFLGSTRTSNEGVLLRFRVLSGGYVAASAQVRASWKTTAASGVLENTLTNEAGIAEMSLALPEGTTELEVKARLQNRETMRRFLVKSAKA
jgi:hypothetical protein